jgi:hypothetical protein
MRSHAPRSEARAMKIAIVISLLLLAWVVGLVLILPAGA